MFFSFRPWWSLHDQRALCLLADTPVNDVTFYLAKDDYPLVYMTDWLDYNEMFSLAPQDAGYGKADGLFGTYYVRLRPAYELADLLVDTPYVYSFYAFSQPYGPQAITDLYPGETLMGMAWEDQAAYFRHFMTDISFTMRA